MSSWQGQSIQLRATGKAINPIEISQKAELEPIPAVSEVESAQWARVIPVTLSRTMKSASHSAYPELSPTDPLKGSHSKTSDRTLDHTAQPPATRDTSVDSPSTFATRSRTANTAMTFHSTDALDISPTPAVTAAANTRSISRTPSRYYKKSTHLQRPTLPQGPLPANTLGLSGLSMKLGVKEHSVVAVKSATPKPRNPR